MKFIGIDGEGLTRDDESHDYVFLASSTKHFVEHWDKGGLSTSECFDFLLALRKVYPGSVFIGFSFSYDTEMMLRDLHRIHVERLREHNRVGWIPLPYLKYTIDYIPHKWMQVTKFHLVNARWVGQGSVKVWDVFGFYQSSFLRALIDWKVGTPEQWERIEEMKAKRGEFKDSEKPQIREYCFEECELLCGLAEQLDDALDNCDLSIKQYHGAGAIANVMLKKHTAKQFIIQRPRNDDLWNATLCAYFGGRVETFFVGYINQPVWSYDINSAYPSAIRSLPNLQAGSWSRTQDYDPSEPYALWRVSWDFRGQKKPLIPFPYRRDKSIYYTLQGEGWYHAPEVSAAYRAGIPFSVKEGIIFRESGNERPFAWVEETFLQRLALKAAGDKREKALKLGLNSLYGKFAQGISANNKPGQYQCYFFAGWITSYCRAAILNVVSQNPGAILNIATDGILSLQPLAVQEGRALGQWEVKEPLDDGLMLIQPGFIISRYQEIIRGEIKKGIMRTRGVDRDSVSFALFKEVWDKDGISGRVKAIDTRFITMGRALAMTENDHDLKEFWRTWDKWELEISYFPNRKLPNFNEDDWQNRGYVDLYPNHFEELRMSEPYQPRSLAALDAEPEPVEFESLERV